MEYLIMIVVYFIAVVVLLAKAPELGTLAIALASLAICGVAGFFAILLIDDR